MLFIETMKFLYQKNLSIYAGLNEELFAQMNYRLRLFPHIIRISTGFIPA